jgi:lipid II isoglutaminyl synthase (glutamine-hydrolysing)
VPAEFPELTIGVLYRSAMSLYGDMGNATVLKRRCEWRGIPVTVSDIDEGSLATLDGIDILLFGGGSDLSQTMVSQDLMEHKVDALRLAVDDGLVVLAICGGYQLLGRYYLTQDGVQLPGAGIVDVHTEASSGSEARLVGNVVADMDWGELKEAPGSRKRADGLSPGTLLGYENHAGRTYLGTLCRPLARVRTGFGNNGQDGTEGAIYRNCYCTYLHGPLLPRNPGLADNLIGLALARRGCQEPLLRLNDGVEQLARRSGVTAQLATNRPGFKGIASLFRR